MDACLLQLLAFVVFILGLFPGCNHSNEPEADPFAHPLDITESPVKISWKLLSNFEEKDKLRAELTLHNTGDEPFEAAGWILYLNSIRALDPDSFLPSLKVTHINGDFFKLEPTHSFEPVAAGESHVIEYQAEYHAIKKTDAPQGFYFVYDDRIETVEQVEIKPFVRDEQVNRNQDDDLEVPTAESRYRKNEELTELSRDQVGKIIPTPVSIRYDDGVYKLADGVHIYFAEEFSGDADYLSHILQEQFEIESSLQPLDGDWNGSEIVLNADPENINGNEAYALRISEEAIELTASDNPGIFYAVQSLRSLISNRNSENFDLAVVEIEDYPQFKYRGMHLDVARNFQPKESVLRLLDIMGTYKMNKFHFHLTDDEGWRLAIDELPELTEVGGRRGHTENEAEFLIPSYGSGPDPVPGNSFGSGWFSRDEYIEILQFANERHIEVIPEVDVPGHARAAIKAMEARTARLNAAGETEEAGKYRLIDEEDASEYQSVQNYDDNVINVCRESTYRFLGLVFDEIIAIHKEAGAPLTTIHVGGDEVPHGAWEKSPVCEEYIQQESIEDVSALQVHFFDRLRTMLEDRGLFMAGWEEVALLEEGDSLSPNPEFVDSVIPNAWSSIWGGETEEYAYMIANAGYKVVMSNASNLYLDMAYNKSWQEPGFYWAAMFTTKDTYSFMPYNLYRNAVQDNYGNPIDPSRYDDTLQLTESGRENILGMQGQLWSETVNRPGRMDYMILPRLLGLAERAWVGNPPWSDISNIDQMWKEQDAAWNEFANRIGRFELNRLSRIHEDISYRLPVPGAIVEDGAVKANSAFPGLKIRYETDGKTPDAESPVYNEPVELSNEDTVTLSIFNSQGRSGRAVSISAADFDGLNN